MEIGGWEAESEAQNLLNELGIGEEFFDVLMRDIDPKIKVKVLLAKAHDLEHLLQLLH